MAELGLITPYNRKESPKMHHNNSKKYESAFVGVSIQESPSILLKSLEGSSLGIWVAHGEGKFYFPSDIKNYNIAIKYNFGQYPANPNGSPESTAAVCSNDGRHLAMMPHPERCLYPHNWAHYPNQRQTDDITPWLDLFTNGYKWILNSKE
jgi:phosphoribosylformylglycinamidine synthase